jgi:hypothetical protein
MGGIMKYIFEIYLDGKPLASAGDNWETATKWLAYYSKQYPGRKLSIKRDTPYIQRI